MPARHAFEYAVVRLVPHVAREEFVNVGVVLFSRTADFLGCQLAVDDARLRALAGTDVDVATLEAHLQAMREVCGGKVGAGAVASLGAAERFHWLVAPRSTSIQISPVHAGVSDDLPATLRHLFQSLVAIAEPAPG